MLAFEDMPALETADAVTDSLVAAMGPTFLTTTASAVAAEAHGIVPAESAAAASNPDGDEACADDFPPLVGLSNGTRTVGSGISVAAAATAAPQRVVTAFLEAAHGAHAEHAASAALDAAFGVLGQAFLDKVESTAAAAPAPPAHAAFVLPHAGPIWASAASALTTVFRRLTRLIFLALLS